MWEIEFLRTDMYHFLAAFFVYSILGWIVESIYMSFCNKKITNRGFAKGPFCPIYGFGASFGYFLLSPFQGNHLVLFFAGAIGATIFEYIVGRVMIKLLGELWWDYNNKPFNFQGIICLESTIAWGVYAIGVIDYVHGFIYKMIDKLDQQVGKVLICVFFAVAVVDYLIQLMKVFHFGFYKKKPEKVIEE